VPELDPWHHLHTNPTISLCCDKATDLRPGPDGVEYTHHQEQLITGLGRPGEGVAIGTGGLQGGWVLGVLIPDGYRDTHVPTSGIPLGGVGG